VRLIFGAHAGTAFREIACDRNRCAIGVNKLRRYRYVTNSNAVTGREPLHDESSHAADALRQFGQMSQTVASSGQWVKTAQARRRVL